MVAAKVMVTAVAARAVAVTGLVTTVATTVAKVRRVVQPAEMAPGAEEETLAALETASQVAMMAGLAALAAAADLAARVGAKRAAAVFWAATLVDSEAVVTASVTAGWMEAAACPAGRKGRTCRAQGAHSRQRYRRTPGC